MLENYQELANAVIELAAKDYRKLAIGYHKVTKQRNRARKAETRKELEYKMRGIKRKITDIETFFTSKWFSELTTVSGKLLLERLRKECSL